ncbi:MAG: site-2 protease family protein, partial [Actinomycetota bacterium]
IPVPPLDGSRLLALVLPPSRGHVIYFLDRWGFLILLLLVFFVLPRPLFLLVNHLSILLLGIVGYA